ncbi:EAL domain-containing protein [Ramlibacter sp. 2FC]|uniref:EAL domain-containing protein n=1 Tax=Ramlibacter sp. 2FC TaxID=2502188 RepID=UPI0010FA4F82|nr:EAL domain-containing protein [Ramlibacter sp. 2FC]
MIEPHTRKAWSDRFSLRAQLAAGFLVAIGLSLAVGLASWMAQEHSVKAVDKLLKIDNRIAELSARSNVAMLKARNAEKDFLLSQSEFGFSEARSRYLTFVRTNVADIRQHMAEIRELVDEADATQQTRAIEQAVTQYQAGFLRVVDLYGQLGQVDTGLAGKFRTKSHEIEPIVSSGKLDPLMIDLLTLRRNEKDFIMRGQGKYAKAFRQSIDQFKADLDSTSAAPAVKGKLLGLANEYQSLFEQYVQAVDRIDVEKKNYLAATQTVEPLLDKLHLNATQRALATREGLQRAARLATWTVLGASVAALLIGLSIASLVSRSIAQSVSECLGFAERVAEGDLGIRMPPRGAHEFGTLAVALNSMTSALQRWRQSSARRTAELAKANETLQEEVAERRLAGQRLARLNKFYAALSETNEAIVRTADRDELFEKVCRICVQLCGTRLAYVGLRDAQDRELRPVARFGPWEDTLGALPMPLGAWGRKGHDPSVAAIPVDRPYVCNDVLQDPSTRPWRAVTEKIGTRAAASFPLHQAGRVAGILCLHAAQTDFFDATAVDLLTEMAMDISFAMDNFERERARGQAEAALRLSQHAIDSSVNAIMMIDHTQSGNPIAFVNPAFERMTGYSPAEALGRNPAFLLGGDTAQPGAMALRDALREEREAHALLRNYRKDGSLFWNDLHIAPVRDDTGKITHFVGVFNDLTEIKNYQEQLERHANSDILTGLANRNLLQDRLSQAITYAHRHNHMVTVALLDLDHFKFVNDSLGHSTGDELLKMVAQRLSDCVRDSDTVARLGGDEFVVIFSSHAEVENIPDMARRISASVATDPRIIDLLQRIHETVSQAVVLADRELHMTCSIGLSLYPQDGRDAETLLKNADAAMYRAKELGRNNFQFYTAELNAKVGERLALQARMRHALERGEFLLHYQPRVEIESGRISGAEALIRWNSPESGLVPPSEFIPILEDSGMILDVGRWAMEAAMSDHGRWTAQGLHPPRIAVNVSQVQLAHQSFTAMIDQVVSTVSGDIPLELEITESLIMKDLEANIPKLTAVGKLGIDIAVDDFGTGYSSLSCLARLPLNVLKIDRAFITDLATSAEDQAIVATIISLAHSLKLKVVAEGVETKEQAHLLETLKCDEIQGYFFSKPLPFEEFARFLEWKGLASLVE